MAKQTANADPNNDPRLNAILAEYLKRKDAGTPIDRQALLQAYPDLADGLRSYFEAEAMMGGRAVAETVRPKTPVPQSPANVRETVRPNAANSDTASEFHSRSFGRYQLLRPLGEGAMGSVFLAQDTTLDRQVALKIPKTDGKSSEDFMSRFSREAKAAAGLKHPNICSVFDTGDHEGMPYITMEFIDGVPLSRFIGSSQLRSVDSVLHMVATIAEAVGHAHSKGVIHRDLKPGNILVDAEFRPVVTDFGLARRTGPEKESRITQEGMLIGTPAYMAPEQVKGEQAKVGPRSDIYSLGVMLFEMLTLRLPFEAVDGNVPEMVAKILRDQPPAPGKFRKDLSEDVDDLCGKMLKKDPDKRFNSMPDVVTAIGQLREKLKRAPIHQADVARQQSPFEIQKSHIEQMLKKGQYAAVIQDLEKLARETLPGAKAVAEWARKTLPGVRAEAKAMNPAGLAALLQTARDMFEKHDYPGCIQLLDDIPSLRRTEAMEDLLEKAHSREAEAEQLLSDIKERERSQSLDGIEVLVKRLLKLKPGNSYAKRLWEALQSYSKTPATRRKYRYDKGRLQPMPEPGFLKQWALLGSLVGVLVFLSVYAYTVFYLKSDTQTLSVQGQDKERKEHGAESTQSGDLTETQNKESWLADKKTGENERRITEAKKLSVPVELVNSIGMKLTFVPAGDFMMGSPNGEPGRAESEGPQHHVRITKPFYMGTSEVTQGQWFELMKTRPGLGTGYVREGDTFPVVFVNFADATAYCEKLSEREGQKYRLPTEAEWEYACRADTATSYSFGNDSSDLAEYGWFGGLQGDGNAKTELYAHVVQTKKPNAFGLYDMHGNVFEWCRDVYDQTAYVARSRTTSDPLSLSGSEYHVLRGGSWYCSSGGARSAYRFHCPAATQNYGNGFRVVRDAAVTSETVSMTGDEFLQMKGAASIVGAGNINVVERDTNEQDKSSENQPAVSINPSNPVAKLSAPILLSPKDGAFLGNRPQKNVMKWMPVPGATLYRVQIQFIIGPNGELGPACDFEAKTNQFENDLNGNRPKRWRVGTASGPTTAWSDWREFRYRP
jgi:serine/threonine protein kinase/formylglycine-generating enzyme required for sulfatase activity